MARPTKTGLNYYPMDVGFLRDKKVRLLKAEFGASSVLFVLYVLGKAYEEDGYFLKWDKDECLITATELGESPAYISEVLQGCLSRSLFDQGVFQVFGVLTSAGIQRRYLTGCEKRADIAIAEEYWLLNIEDKNDVPPGVRAKLTFLMVSGGKNEVNSPRNGVNSPDNRQSKVKESKVKESKEEKSVGKADRFTLPTLNEVKTECSACGYIVNADTFFDHYQSNGWMVGRVKMKDWKATLRNWNRKDNEGRGQANGSTSKPVGKCADKSADEKWGIKSTFSIGD